jgi:hypothetical protein
MDPHFAEEEEAYTDTELLGALLRFLLGYHAGALGEIVHTWRSGGGGGSDVAAPAESQEAVHDTPLRLNALELCDASMELGAMVMSDPRRLLPLLEEAARLAVRAVALQVDIPQVLEFV